MADRGLRGTICTVAWALFGVRGHKPQADGGAPLSPWKILLTALVFMLVFVVALVSVAIYLGGQ